MDLDYFRETNSVLITYKKTVPVTWLTYSISEHQEAWGIWETYAYV